MTGANRPIVTGHDADGRSVVVAAGAAPRTFDFGANAASGAYYWGTRGIPIIPAETDDTTLAMPSVFPGPGSTSFVIGQFPGDSQGGLHATDTVDYLTILSGGVWLLLDGGDEVHPTPGDPVVQNGTRHAWRNRQPNPCVFMVVLGAPHADSASRRASRTPQRLLHWLDLQTLAIEAPPQPHSG